MADQTTNFDDVTRVESSQHVDPTTPPAQAEQAMLSNMSATNQSDQNLESFYFDHSGSAPALPEVENNTPSQPNQIQSWDDAKPEYYNTSYSDYWQHHGYGQYSPFSYK